ncbi:MAG: methylmalonyl-CoA mutase family protein [Xanthobacteraceae bacterium]
MSLTSRSGVPLQRLYTAADGTGERPGEFPFTRGRLANPHSNAAWIQRELSGEGDGRRSNAQIRYLLEHGQTGIDVIGDAPTQSLLDPDHPLARDAVGTQGVSLCRKQDFLDLFEGVPFDRVSVSNSAPGFFAVAGLVLAAREAGVPLSQLRGSVLHAPLYTEDCSYAWHLPVAFRVRLALDSIAFCTEQMPKFHAYLEDTYFFSESGLAPLEEVALGFVQLRHLVRGLRARGLPVDAFAPRIAMLVNCGMDFFEEIAKIRATRRLYATMMRDEFGAQNPRSLSLAITSHTSGLSLTAQQPVNNIVRGAIQALSLVLAGVQALEISAFDEAFRTPSKDAHIVGLRSQQIIDLESGVAKVLDPLGGSYFVEALTDELAKRIRARVDDIETMSDPEKLSNEGYFRNLFHQAMEDGQRAVETGELPVVGVNVHTMAAEDDTLLRDVATSKIEPWHAHTGEIERFKRERSPGAVCEGLARVAGAARGSDNIVPAVIAALDASATMGEIATTMRRALGMPPDIFDHPLPQATAGDRHVA